MAEAEKIYVSACAVLKQHFSSTGSVHPQITLVLGADHIPSNHGMVNYDGREVRMDKWNKQLFAQGVIVLGLSDLMPPSDRRRLADRAVDWADATIDVSAWRSGDK